MTLRDWLSAHPNATWYAVFPYAVPYIKSANRDGLDALDDYTLVRQDSDGVSLSLSDAISSNPVLRNAYAFNEYQQYEKDHLQRAENRDSE
jgi:hypothetical protein